MSTTPVYGITEWDQNQEQPHVTINTAIRMLEALSARVLTDRTLTAPPGSPADGGVYYINGTGTGAWAGHADELALYIAGVWKFVVPKNGWVFWSTGDSEQMVFVEASPSGWEFLPT